MYEKQMPRLIVQYIFSWFYSVKTRCSSFLISLQSGMRDIQIDCNTARKREFPQRRLLGLPWRDDIKARLNYIIFRWKTTSLESNWEPKHLIFPVLYLYCLNTDRKRNLIMFLYLFQRLFPEKRYFKNMAILSRTYTPYFNSDRILNQVYISKKTTI